MEGARITELDTFSGTPGSNDYLALDNSSSGTKKMSVPNLLACAEPTAEDVAYDESQTYSSGTVGKALKDIDVRFGEVEDEIENVVSDYFDALNDATVVQTQSDSTPYLFRPTNNAGHLEYDEIVGGSVAWNQLVQNGNFADTSKWQAINGSLSVSNNVATVTATGDAYIRQDGLDIPANHVCLFCGELTVNDTERIINYQGYTQGWASCLDTTSSSVVIAKPSATLARVFCAVVNHTASGDTLKYKNINVFDLTQLFGSTVADYIYSLEQSQAGAGVAKLKQWGFFTSPYYAYNAGELKHVSGLTSHDMTGFNQWDEEWEVGGIDPTTGANISTSEIRSKNYIEVLPNTAYYCYVGSSAGQTYNIKSRFYDADKNYIGTGGYWKYNAAFTSPSGAQYLRFAMQPEYGTTYKNDICINISWDGSRNGEYEAYDLHSYPLDSDLTLRGIPKLDANNNLYYDGDVYEPDGTVTRKYGIVDLGTLNWVYTSGDNSRFSALIQSIALTSTGAEIAPLLCPKFVAGSIYNIYGHQSDKIIAAHNSNHEVWVYDSTAGTDATAFKTAMNGVYLVYELATPTTETADPFTSPQVCDPLGTEQYVVTEQSVFAIPIGHNTKYPQTLSDIVPTSNGNYVLKCTVTNGVASYSWVSA